MAPKYLDNLRKKDRITLSHRVKLNPIKRGWVYDCIDFVRGTWKITDYQELGFQDLEDAEFIFDRYGLEMKIYDEATKVERIELHGSPKMAGKRQHNAINTRHKNLKKELDTTSGEDMEAHEKQWIAYSMWKVQWPISEITEILDYNSDETTRFVLAGIRNQRLLNAGVELVEATKQDITVLFQTFIDFYAYKLQPKGRDAPLPNPRDMDMLLKLIDHQIELIGAKGPIVMELHHKSPDFNNATIQDIAIYEETLKKELGND